jgi:hypothetical protein
MMEKKESSEFIQCCHECELAVLRARYGTVLRDFTTFMLLVLNSFALRTDDNSDEELA